MTYQMERKEIVNKLGLSFFPFYLIQLKRNGSFYGNCTARQCSPLRRKFMECSINNPALTLLMKHLVIGQRLKTPNFSAFHWSPRGSLVSTSQQFVATR